MRSEGYIKVKMVKTGAVRSWITAVSLRFLTAVIISVLLELPALAGALASCEKPRVFSGAAVNAVILPYRYTGPNRYRSLSETGHKLSRLLQLEVLFSMLKHGNVGATELTGEPGRCDVNSVLKEIMRRRPDQSGALRPGRALVILWGRIFEDGDDIYLQSYLQFFRREETETMRISVKGPDERRIEFTGHLPATKITFKPRRMTRTDMKSIQDEFKRSTVIRPYPDLEQKGRSLAEWPAWKRFSYRVTNVRNNWIHIQSQEDGTRGWVRARIDPWAWPLRRKMPELAFLDAVVGYLRYQVGHQMKDVLPAHPETAERVANALKVYTEFAGSRIAPLPRAVGNAMLGMMRINSAQTEAERVETMRAVAPLFVEARQMIPYSAEARNLETISRLYLDFHSTVGKENSMKLVKKLLNAVAVEPDNPSALVNLEHLYTYFTLQPKRNPYSTSELQQRLSEVKRIRAQMSDKTKPF